MRRGILVQIQGTSEHAFPFWVFVDSNHAIFSSWTWWLAVDSLSDTDSTFLLDALTRARASAGGALANGDTPDSKRAEISSRDLPFVSW